MKGQAHVPDLDLSIDEAAALLNARPARWLSGFLRLATHSVAGHIQAYVAADHWYRLRAPQLTADGEVRARLVWHPHLGDPVFTAFYGEIRVRPAQKGVQLSIEGDLEGGTPDANQTVLEDLARLIAGAASNRQTVGG